MTVSGRVKSSKSLSLKALFPILSKTEENVTEVSPLFSKTPSSIETILLGISIVVPVEQGKSVKTVLSLASLTKQLSVPSCKS